MLKSKGIKSVTYVGYTNNLKKRINLHNSGKGAKFTRGRKWVLIYKEKFNSKKEAISLITINPAINLGLNHKGRIDEGADADLCVLDDSYSITDVFAQGCSVLQNGELIVKNSF